MVTFDAETMKRRLQKAVESQRQLRLLVARSPGDTELETTPSQPEIEGETLEAFDIDDSEDE